MNIEVSNTVRIHACEQREAPSHPASYGCRRAGETLALDLRYDAERRAVEIQVTGSVLGTSPAEADQRRDRQLAVLAALLHAQYPGFVFKPRMQGIGDVTASAMTTVLKPIGRRATMRQERFREPGPHSGGCGCAGRPAAALGPVAGAVGGGRRASQSARRERDVVSRPAHCAVRRRRAAAAARRARDGGRT